MKTGSTRFDQLQHLRAQATGTSFAIESLKNHLGRCGDVTRLSLEPCALLQLGCLGHQDLPIRTVHR